MSTLCVGVYKWICTMGVRCLLDIVIINTYWESSLGVW